MIKILDKYIIKTFFGPFFFIFSVLFFILIVNVVWVQLGNLMGKGLTYFEIIKLLFYFGMGVINLVMPLTILLTSIMTFGEFGERYELAAMKAAGISLFRIMKPLFATAILLATILFFFSNNIIPSFQKKGRNMLYNIKQSRLALNFTPGQFIDQLPKFYIKFDEISGENGEFLKGVYIHKKANSYEDQQTIIAERGLLGAVPQNKNYLKLTLYNGYVHEENISNKTFDARNKQPDQVIKFDTLSQLFDISEIINREIENEKITDDPRFLNFFELGEIIKKDQKTYEQRFQGIGNDLTMQLSPYLNTNKEVAEKYKNPKQQFYINKLDENQQLSSIQSAYMRIENQRNTLQNNQSTIMHIFDDYGHLVMYQQRILTFSFICIIFFMIGSSLGSIIRKGGVGMPVVIAIVIFIIYYLMNLTVENLAWDGTLDPYIAAWIPSIILTPFAFWLIYNALTDSQLFDIEKYKTFFKPILNRFRKKNQEHTRYQ